MKVVFDTNVFGAIASPADYVNFDENVCAKLREAILAGKVQPFISAGSISLESLGHAQRIDEFFREWATKS